MIFSYNFLINKNYLNYVSSNPDNPILLSNLSNLLTIPNNILQGDMKTAAVNSGRLVVNSTIGILGIFDTFSGGALGRMGIFALGVMPYISSSIIMTLMQGSIPYMKNLKEQGSKGQRQLRQLTRYFTVLIAALQC